MPTDAGNLSIYATEASQTVGLSRAEQVEKLLSAVENDAGKSRAE